MSTCRALRQVVNGSLIRRASTPSRRRKRFKSDSMKYVWGWGPWEEGWDQWGWWRGRRQRWGGGRGGRRRGTGGGAAVEMCACWLKSRQYPDFFLSLAIMGGQTFWHTETKPDAVVVLPLHSSLTDSTLPVQSYVVWPDFKMVLTCPLRLIFELSPLDFSVSCTPLYSPMRGPPALDFPCKGYCSTPLTSLSMGVDLSRTTKKLFWADPRRGRLVLLHTDKSSSLSKCFENSLGWR